jgi:hypothetical protein
MGQVGWKQRKKRNVRGANEIGKARKWTDFID